jgi:hypothetical protein
MVNTINVELTLRDVHVIFTALTDLTTAAGGPVWEHPNVHRLCEKLADAIRDELEVT